MGVRECKRHFLVVLTSLKKISRLALSLNFFQNYFPFFVFRSFFLSENSNTWNWKLNKVWKLARIISPCLALSHSTHGSRPSLMSISFTNLEEKMCFFLLNFLFFDKFIEIFISIFYVCRLTFANLSFFFDKFSAAL